MSKFHSTISRRDFMKGLGLAGAGIGAASLVAPGFHDLDEAAASPGAEWKRSWFVKQVEKPTVDIDWNLYQRLDQRQVNDYMPGSQSNDSQEMKDLRANNTATVEKWCTERFYPEWKGTTVRDLAFKAGASKGSDAESPGYGAPFLGIPKAKTPQQLGLPRWEGTPEDNLRMLRAAFRTLGCAHVGVIELDNNHKKMVWSHQQRCGEAPTPLKIVRNKRYDFEDVDEAYYTDEKMVIPNKCRYMIVWTTLMTPELVFREGSVIGGTSSTLAYNRSSFINSQVMEFVHALGYQTLSAYRSNMTPAVLRGVLSGVGEHNRMAFPTLSAEYGMFLRTVNGIVTDMPLSPTNPTDAGLFKFCKTCKICSESCPYGSLPEGDPSWESEFPGHSIFAGNSPGYEGYRLFVNRCTKCGVCQGRCPFNTTGQSIVHDIIRTTVATTPLINKFFADSERAFGYGFKNPESFWDMKEYPIFGIHTKFLDI